MPDPNSRLTAFRRYLAARLEPRPDPGEAWCIGCELNGGRTVVLAADGHVSHMYMHKASEGSGDPRHIKILVGWPAR